MTTLLWVYYVAETTWPWVLAVGGFGAALGWRPGGWVLLAVVCERIPLHIAVGVNAYRRVMSHPWPDVPALTDDDDDW